MCHIYLMRTLLSSLLIPAVLLAASLTSSAEPAPAWKLTDLNGKTVQLSDFKGKVVILDFWATWCGPCRAEIPDFVALQDQYRDKGLVVVGISLDQDGAKVVAPFAKHYKINYPIVLGDDNVASQYGNIQAIPTTFIIDSNGNIVGSHEGVTEKSVFEAEIKKLLPMATASNP